MITKMPWFERKFNFDFPVNMLPCIVERLRGMPARLDEIVKLLPPKYLITKINGWTIQEHIGHLLDLDELHEGRIEDYKKGLPTLRPADLTNKKTYDADHNKNDIAYILERFREERLNFVDLLEELTETEASAVAEHPRLKQPMRVVDMAYFVAEHDDHHIATMREIINRIEKMGIAGQNV